MSLQAMARRNSKQAQAGFTWLELCVILFILGLLSAIALLSFLDQAACACVDPEAKGYTGSIARAQRAFFLENQRFTASLSELGLSIASETDAYRYGISSGKVSAFSYGIAKQSDWDSYVSGTFILSASDNLEPAIATIICKAGPAEIGRISLPIDFETCGEGSKLVSQSVLLIDSDALDFE